MRKFLKWVGIVLGGLIVLVILAGAGLSLSTNARLNRVYDIQPESVAIPTDAASLEEGQRLASIYCADCHGADFAGTDFFNDPALAIVDSANLTAGNGGIGVSYTDEDWVRSIRHGVDPEGRALFIMPSKEFYYFNDEDLGQLIAYLKSVSPVDRESTPFKAGIVGRVLMGLGVFGDVFNAENIPHELRPTAVPAAVSPEYGEYLVNTFGCRTCHGETLAGGLGPEPGMPPGPNLTPGGDLGKISDQDFINIVRAQTSDYMPFESLAKMSDEELSAIWTYLQSLPALETEN